MRNDRVAQHADADKKANKRVVLVEYNRIESDEEAIASCVDAKQGTASSSGIVFDQIS